MNTFSVTVTMCFSRVISHNGYCICVGFIAFLIGLFTLVSSPNQVTLALYFGQDKIVTPSHSHLSFMNGQVSSTENGNVYVVWGNLSGLFFKSIQQNGTKFSSPICLSDKNSNSSSPQTAATDNGHVYVVWVDKNDQTGVSYLVLRSSEDFGKNFGHDVILNMDSNPNQSLISSYSPRIAATENGSVYVVWVDKKNTTGDSDIAFSSSNDSGKHFSRKMLRSNDLLSLSPQIAATENGGVYVVWVDKNSTTGDSNVVFKSSNDYGKNFADLVHLSKNKKTESLAPQIDATERGSVYVVWSDNSLQFKEILDSGSIYGMTIPLSNSLMQPLSPQVLATSKGDVYILWVDNYNYTKIKNSNDSALVFKKASETFFDRNS